MWAPRTRLSTQHPWRIRSRCINETIPDCIEPLAQLDDIYLFVHPNFWFVHFLIAKFLWISRKSRIMSYLFLFLGLRSYAYLLDGLRRVVPEEVHEPLDPHGHCQVHRDLSENTHWTSLVSRTSKFDSKRSPDASIALRCSAIFSAVSN